MPIKRTFNRTAPAMLPAKPDYVVAIDPDVDKNGLAVLQPSTRLLETSQVTFPALLEALQSLQKQYSGNRHTMIVLVEAGYLNRSNWHTAGQDKTTAVMIGNRTGRNHEIARKIVEMCRHYGLDVVEFKPLRKAWGTDGKQKISHAELAAFTKLKGRTNPEERDAALIAWTYAGLPIIIPPKR